MYFNTSKVIEVLRPLSIHKLAKKDSVVEKAKTLVAAYYYLLPFVAFLFANNPIAARQNFEPFWPLAWVHLFDISYPVLVLLIQLSFIAITLLATFFYRHHWARVLVFLVLFQVQALESSFGALNHQWYLWLYTSAAFVLLPNIWRTPSAQGSKKFLLYIWFAQALAMLTYTMAGMWKFIFTFYQAAIGEVHGFAVNAFAYQIADWTLRLQEEAVLAPYIIAFPALGWPFYVGIHFLQLFAIWTMVRTSLQKFWALMLVLFHFGAFLTMGISFHPLIILIIILFFFSPFAPEKVTVRQFVRDLPVIGFALSKLGAKAQ